MSKVGVQGSLLVCACKLEVPRRKNIVMGNVCIVDEEVPSRPHFDTKEILTAVPTPIMFKAVQHVWEHR